MGGNVGDFCPAGALGVSREFSYCPADGSRTHQRRRDRDIAPYRSKCTDKVAGYSGLAPEMDRLGSGRHFVSARLIGGSIGCALSRLNQTIGKQIGFDFLATDIGQHMAVDFHAGTEHLAALFDHLLTLHRVVDDVPIFILKVIFAHDGADTLAPATGWFEVSDDLWFIHR